MKKESQPYNTLSDGSRYYGNDVWGPSTLDLQRANLSFPNEQPNTKEEPNNHLLLVSQESVFGRFFQTASKIRLPAKFAIPVGLAVAVLATACGSKNSEKSKLPSAPSPSESGAPPPENPFAVLNMPFPKDRQMAIQQGWLYTDIKNREHKGIDYINGRVDNSDTWKSFPVLAAADGFACANPPSREGNAVLLTHKIGDTSIGATYYGHLDAIEKDIPACDDKAKTPKLEKRGAKLGEAGATGVKDDRGIEQPTWKHLHFQVNDANGNPIDPYDIQKERDVYPDPNFKNGNPCGPKALFIDCYPKGAVVASPKDPIPPISGQVTERKVEDPTATPTPTAIPTPKPTETPKPTSTVEKPVEKGWNRFTSTRLQIDYPLSWTKKSREDKVEQDTYIDLTLNNKNGNAELSIDDMDLDPEYSSLDSFKKHFLEQWYGDDRKAYQEIPQVISGQKAWKLELEPNPEHVFVVTVTKDRGWRILLSAEQAEDWKTIQTMLSSIKFLEPTETLKPATEKKVSLSKKPEELYRALLTNSISPNILPQGMSSRGISAREIDATGKAINQIGAVNIKIEDSVSTASGGVFYAIFPDSSTAKSASELLGTHLGNGQVLKDFPYSAKIYTTGSGGLLGVISTVVVVPVENVMIATSLTGTNALIQSRAISLGHAAIEHLGKVGK